MTRCKKCRQNLDQQVGFRNHLHLCRVPRPQWNAAYETRTAADDSAGLRLQQSENQTEASFLCLDCAATYPTEHGLSVHRGRTHKAVTA